MPVVVTPAEIDITTAEPLRGMLLELARAGHPTVVVDLTRTLFCDSSGLHALVRAQKRAVSAGGELRLVMPADGSFPRIMKLTGLGSVFSCFPSLAEALACTPGRRDAASQATERACHVDGKPRSRGERHVTKN